MTTSRELIALRTHLATHLHPADASRLAWPVVASIAGPGIERGWAGAELAAAAMLGVYSGGVENPAAYIAANLQDLAAADPPREITPGPPLIATVLADIHAHHRPAEDAGAWVARIRSGAHAPNADRHAPQEPWNDRTGTRLPPDRNDCFREGMTR